MTLDPYSFERVRKLVYERAGIVLEPGKEYLVLNRLAAIAQAHKFSDINALCAKLDARPSLVNEVVEAMTTNETSFFRDQHPFEALRQAVLPELIERRQKARTLRFWCAACSTGQEPYSLAIMLDQSFPQLAGWNVSILATDISKSVLTRASEGRYRQLEVNRGLNASTLLRYFQRVGTDWQIRAELKRGMQFVELNLAGLWPQLPCFDVVFVRNVLIYFDQPTKIAVLKKVRGQLADDGYLVLGGSETTPTGMTQFERLSIPRSGLYAVASGGGARASATR